MLSKNDNKSESLFNWVSSSMMIIIGAFMSLIIVLGMYVIFVNNPEVWINFLGAIFGGLVSGGLTFAGVYYTINRNDKHLDKMAKEQHISQLPNKLRKLDTIYYSLLKIVEEQDSFNRFMREIKLIENEVYFYRLSFYSKKKISGLAPLVDQSVDIDKNLYIEFSKVETLLQSVASLGDYYRGVHTPETSEDIIEIHNYQRRQLANKLNEAQKILYQTPNKILALRERLLNELHS